MNDTTFYLTKTFVVPKNTTMDNCRFILIKRMNLAIDTTNVGSCVQNSFIEINGLLSPRGSSIVYSS